MKFIHLSDLHLGKKLYQYSLIDDQDYILHQILEMVEKEKPQAVIIAGDLFDKQIPSLEAVNLAGSFFKKLQKICHNILVISGNHDSAERLSFMAPLMREGIYFAQSYQGTTAPITLRDQYGPINFWLLPFIKPAMVRSLLTDEAAQTIESYQQAVQYAISRMNIPAEQRNILVTHQYITGATTCESEELSIGGTDNVDARVFAPFDYVALGHLHGAQAVGRKTIRYCGTPLKYSLSEIAQQKSVTVVEITDKKDITINELPLIPQHELRVFEDSFEKALCLKTHDDYIFFKLTDEQEQPEAASRLQNLFPHYLGLDYVKMHTNGLADLTTPVIGDKKPLELIADFFQFVTQEELNPAEQKLVSQIAGKIWKE